jgi:proprotein convertase subtilisin/kexin type 5
MHNFSWFKFNTSCSGNGEICAVSGSDNFYCDAGFSIKADLTCIATASCPPATEILVDSSKICQTGTNCHTSCFTCSGAAATNCLTCLEGFTRNAGECVPCDLSCGSCNGLNNNDCTTCKPLSFLSEVPPSSGNWLCESCHISCRTGCNGPLASDCWDCKSEGYYDTGSTCGTCDSTCLSCYGPNPYNCLSCIYGWFKNGSTCEFRNCATGTEYLDPLIFDCKICLVNNVNCG